MGKREKREKKSKKPSAKGAIFATPPYAGRQVPLEHIDGIRWRVPKTGTMNVDGIVYADETLLPSLQGDQSLAQVANVATLPGIVSHSLAMPDIHWGYGFPIGGVAAFDPQGGGMVSPGGVGYDINCGVRLLASDVAFDRVGPRIQALVDDLFHAIPAGV